MSEIPEDRFEDLPEDQARSVPAATVIVFRNARAGGSAPEVLMVQRSGEMRFAGGAAVFPGGRVDPADHELAARLDHGLVSDGEAAIRIAALRETLEEAGLALGAGIPVAPAQVAEARQLLHETGRLDTVADRFGWRIDLSGFHRWARWCPRFAGAFDTHFYLADIGTGAVEVTADATENTRLFWASAAEALAMADRGEIKIIFPTRRNLERLALCDSFVAARDFAASFPPTVISPSKREIGSKLHLTIPDGLGYPVTEQIMDTVRRG
jgi:8-oxo-dGTP pyrophosphatase MutT (NUDIX family)